jgi:predicted nucleic acid-binding protein
LRNKSTGQAIESKFALSTRPERPLLSSIVEGELRGLAAYWGWGPAKIAKLEQTLSELVRVSAGAPEIVKAYGVLYAHQTKIGKKVGENDLWLAATAAAVNGTVLTCDSDFLRLDPAMVSYVHFPA